MRIGIIGRTDRGLVDGQTIKTRTLLKALKKRYPSSIIIVADLSHYKRCPMKTLLSIVKCLIHSEYVFILLSSGGRRVVFPIVCALNRFLKRRIYHDVIGGALAKRAASDAILRKQIASFDRNWVESKKMVDDLHAIGVNNAEYLPNFKNNEILSIKQVSSYQGMRGDNFKFCTLSRVSREKGLSDAIRAIQKTRDRRISLDIYGPVEEGYEEEFKKLLASCGAVKYCGVIDSSQTVKTIAPYFALLFPTFWRGEGFPGTLIDAFDAGLPVVASKWGMNTELIEDGVNGFLFAPGDIDALASRIEWMVANFEKVDAMRGECLSIASNYAADKVMQTIERAINE